MGKVKELKPKSKYVLGTTIEETSYEEMKKIFDTYVDIHTKKKYAVNVTQEEINFLLTTLIPNVKWKGQQVFDFESIVKMVGEELKPDVDVKCKPEAIRGLFIQVYSQEYEGTDNIYLVMNLLKKLSVVTTSINEDETKLQMAGLELQAAEQGILPEKLRESAEQAQKEEEK